MTIVHINVPYSMLLHRIDFAIKNRINPEIYFSARIWMPAKRRMFNIYPRPSIEANWKLPFMVHSWI